MSANCIESDTEIESWQKPTTNENETRSSDQQRALDRELLIASREFAVDRPLQSWWHLTSTMCAVLFFAAVAGLGQAVWLRSLASILTGLTLVRMFILYHDYQHNTILTRSKLAKVILNVYGNLMLTPPSAWKHSHDHHHHHNSKLFGTDIGSFPIMTSENYRKASLLDRLSYRIARNPLVILMGYFPVFLYGMCIHTAHRDPRRHWDAFTSMLLHFGFIAACWWFTGWVTTAFVFLLPAWIATCIGTYLFYIQHNFPDAKIRDGDEWSYTHAALQSSSLLEMGPVMHWMTGNIGYHHVHHLNSKIPFYRLPEAMKALEPLQQPKKTSLKIRDIIDCLQLKFWDEEQDRLITYAEFKAL